MGGIGKASRDARAGLAQGWLRAGWSEAREKSLQSLQSLQSRWQIRRRVQRWCGRVGRSTRKEGGQKIPQSLAVPKTLGSAERRPTTGVRAARRVRRASLRLCGSAALRALRSETRMPRPPFADASPLRAAVASLPSALHVAALALAPGALDALCPTHLPALQ